MLKLPVMLDSQTAEGLIKPQMPVVGSNNTQFAVVDHLEGRDMIKLTKDATGQHHYIPLTWVAAVDDKVHVDRPDAQAMREWTTTATVPKTPPKMPPKSKPGQA